MPITINGSGTVTGISAGGLPDGVITTDDIAAGAVTDAKVNASAAIADSKLTGRTCKAFVNFNGTGTVTMRANYNVSSITDHGNGDFTVNFSTALADADYSAVVDINGNGHLNGTWMAHAIFSSAHSTTVAPSSSGFRFCTFHPGNLVNQDCTYNNVAVFR